jgi:hypothetical protein
MSPASRQICHSVKNRPARLRSRLISAYACRRNGFFAPSRRCRRVRRRDAVPLARCFQRIGSRFRTVKIAPVNERCTRIHTDEEKNQQKPREPFHGIDANRSATACQCLRLFHQVRQGCAMPILRGNSLSVRGYGLRTYKSRQGRNAATVV